MTEATAERWLTDPVHCCGQVGIDPATPMFNTQAFTLLRFSFIMNMSLD